MVATFKFVHDDPSQLPGAAFIALGAAALLAGWAMFIMAQAAVRVVHARGITPGVSQCTEATLLPSRCQARLAISSTPRCDSH